MALLFVTPSMAATSPDLFDMMEQLDKSDKQDFQAAIDKANACTRARNFRCSASELARAAKAANSGQDKKVLLASQSSLANEQQQLANEIRRNEEERQAQIRRDEEQRQAQARAEAAAEDRRQTAANISGLMSILGSTATNYAALKAQQQVTASLGNNLLADSQRAADAMRADTERRTREARQQQAQADALRQEQARAAQERAQLQTAQRASLSSTSSTTPRQQVALDAIAAARPVQQTVAIPTWDSGPRKTMEPVRTEPAPLVASSTLSAGQLADPCPQRGSIRSDCGNTPQTCPVGQSLVNGLCVTPTMSCLAPAVLVQGRCVSPNINAGNTNTNAPTTNQTRPAPVAPTTVSVAPAPTKIRPAPSPQTTVSGPPEPERPITATFMRLGSANYIALKNISPRKTWRFALTIYNCVNIKTIWCRVHHSELTPGLMDYALIAAEDDSQPVSYEYSIDLIKSY